MGDNTVKEMTVKLFGLQEQRVGLYNLLHKEYKLYKESGVSQQAGESNNEPFIRFRQVCKDVSDKFNQISKEIIDIKGTLTSSSSINADNIPKLIENLQTLEQNKFKLTIKLYLMQENDDLDDPADIKSELNEIVESINQCIEEIRSELYEN